MNYQIIRSNRKTIALQINDRGELLVRCPVRMGKDEIAAFVQRHQDWIQKHSQKHHAGTLPPFTRQELEELMQKACSLIPLRVRYWAQRMGVCYGKITIRNQKTRWGSCSSKGNLNFNCTLMLAPSEVLDYVIVHELCHRKQMNHSPQFWAEVEKYIPDHKLRRAWLKEHSHRLIGRL